MPMSAPNFNELPPRIFDLLPYYIDKFSDRKCLFASIKDGKTVEYDGLRFCELTDKLSMALLRLGLRKGDKVALIANSSPHRAQLRTDTPVVQDERHRLHYQRSHG